MIKIFKTGPHATRTPLSYPALAPLFGDSVTLTDTPSEADLYVFAHPLDVADAPRALIEDWRARRRPVVILSEEPFWDTIWGQHPTDRHLVLDTRFGALPVIQLNHHTSDIFHFDRIPYYLLTNHRFANAYGARFTRNSALRPDQWQARFAARPVDTVFMFERRPEPYHAVRWPAGDIIGLCSWRTNLAEASADLGGVIERLGQSWQGGRTRFDLDNWYLDKLTRLDGRCRNLAAFENTHQPDYITEKLFDAFACGARPLYFASPGHRIHDLGLPPASWMNLYDLDPVAAAARIAQNPITPLTPDMFEAFTGAQQQLARLFCDPAIWTAERARLKQALIRALRGVLDTP